MNLVDVYPYRYVSGQYEFLILKRSPDKQYAEQWRMVGGKIQENEAAWEAGLRELKEETSVVPGLFWTIPSVNSFYSSKNDKIEMIPAFAALVPKEARIILNEEHTEYLWIESGETDNFIHWPEQQRLISLTNSILNSEILDDWIIQC